MEAPKLIEDKAVFIEEIKCKSNEIKEALKDDQHLFSIMSEVHQTLLSLDSTLTLQKMIQSVTEKLVAGLLDG